MPSDLAGLRVVITRPIGQAAELQSRLKAAGASPLLFPLLAITESRQPDALKKALSDLGDGDLLIFISPNAVRYGLAQLNDPLPTGLLLGCVGRGTARTLERAIGREPQLLPHEGYDSEALLALSWLQPERINGKKVLIVRGEGGREHLAESLRARGAQVEYAEVYRRSMPNNDPEKLLEPLRRKEIDIISVTSSEALDNLIEFAKNQREALQQTPLVVFHQRIAEAARQRGFNGPILVCEQPGDEGLLETLRRWRQAE